MTQDKSIWITFAALLTAAVTGPALAQDPTFDIEAEDPAVETQLTDKEEDLRALFEDSPMVDREVYESKPDFDRSDYETKPVMTTRGRAEILDREDTEFGQYNDMDPTGIDMASGSVAVDQSDLEEPLSAPVQRSTMASSPSLRADCPANTTPQPNGDCLAGPNYKVGG